MADCSFCGKGEDEVVRLVPGPGVAICNECIVTCGQVLDAQGDGRPHRRYATVTPRMVVGDVDGAVAFLQAALGATVEGESGGPVELRIGDSLVMVGGAELRDVFPTFVYVYVDDADDAHRRAVAAGAETIEAPLDTPYGDRRAMVRDPWGNLYQLAHHRA